MQYFQAQAEVLAPLGNFYCVHSREKTKSESFLRTFHTIVLCTSTFIPPPFFKKHFQREFDIVKALCHCRLLDGDGV